MQPSDPSIGCEQSPEYAVIAHMSEQQPFDEHKTPDAVHETVGIANIQGNTLLRPEELKNQCTKMQAILEGQLYAPPQMPTRTHERTLEIVDDHRIIVEGRLATLNNRQTALFNTLVLSPMRAIHTTHAALLGLTNRENTKTRMRAAGELRDKLYIGEHPYVTTESVLTQLATDVRIINARPGATHETLVRSSVRAEHLMESFWRLYRQFPPLHDPSALQERTVSIAIDKFSSLPEAMQALRHYSIAVGDNRRQIRELSPNEQEMLAFDVYTMAQVFSSSGGWHMKPGEFTPDQLQVLAAGAAAYTILMPSCTRAIRESLTLKGYDPALAPALASRAIKRFNPHIKKQVSLAAALTYTIATATKPPRSMPEQKTGGLSAEMQQRLQDIAPALSNAELVVVALRNGILRDRLPAEGVVAENGTRTSYATLAAQSLRGQLSFRHIGAVLGLSDGFVRNTYAAALAKAKESD